MDIVIHCGGMPFNGNTINERSLGGSETAAYYVAKELAAKGHKVLMFTNDRYLSTEKAIREYHGVSYSWAGEVSEQAPLGQLFHFYALNTPHDVLIIQRHPHAFMHNWASKINLLWLHDLALYRTAGMINQQMWNIDGVLTVSEYHKKQVCDVYQLNPDIVMPIQNGIDLELYAKETSAHLAAFHDRVNKGMIDPAVIEDRINFIYSSRPERGLIHHVREGGIMERLWEIDKRFHLYVCAYDNVTPQMKDLYEYLWARCEELPNVTNLGALTKQELADVQRQCDACVYPTEFEEVSCITAMECMAAGLPFISSEHAALSETCKGSGSLLFPLKDGQADENAFVETFSKSGAFHTGKAALGRVQLKEAEYFTWGKAANMLLGHIDTIFSNYQDNGAIARQFMRNSDIQILKAFLEANASEVTNNDILWAVDQELQECYGFSEPGGDIAKHYETYYKYEAGRGVNYGPEDVTGNSRYQCVFNFVVDVVNNSDHPITVLDYGCAHGHYTVNMAKALPNVQFLGVDIAESNIEKAQAWAESEGLTNVEFYVGSTEDGLREIGAAWKESGKSPDVALACEVVEHVVDPEELLNGIKEVCAEDAQLIVTTPYGPWEAQGYKEHWPWRAHLWHFDKADIDASFKHLENYTCVTVPSGVDAQSEHLGSFVYRFNPGTDPISIKMGSKKVEHLAPRQTVSVCMIVRNAEDTILKTLKSTVDFVDEFVIGVDNETTDSTVQVIESFFENRKGSVPYHMFDISSPRVIGFDAARNLTLKEASSQWIMWIDADEVLYNGEALCRYLRHNQYNGYAIQQHHFAVEPLGVLKTDLPCRIFRNHKGIQFFGLVHEHPELELNKGAGHVQLISDMCIKHDGYATEQIRRERFNRNIPLMAKDREVYPDRHLGKFLWIRDLAQMTQYELELNGGQVQDVHIQRAKEGMKLWEELLKDGHTRMILDGMNYYSMLSSILGNGFEYSFKLKGSKLNGGADLAQAQEVKALWHKKEHPKILQEKLFDQEVANYESRYF